MLFKKPFPSLIFNLIRTRTKHRKIRPKMIHLPCPTPINDTVCAAWKGFDGIGSGKNIEEYHNNEVQAVMKRLIGRNSKLLKNINMARDPVIAEYKLVHPDKFNKLKEESETILDRFLETIPLKTEREKDNSIILMQSEELENFDTSSFVFTDISASKNNSDRTIVIRRPNGNLISAPWRVRDRINIVYFGSDTHIIPRPTFITNDKFLKDALKIDKHLYILNYTYSICNADDPDYIRVFKTIFNEVIENSKYSLLELTPFFGPLLYYAIKNYKFKNIVKYYYDIKKSFDKDKDLYLPPIFDTLKFEDLMELYSLLKPFSETAKAFREDPDSALEVFLKSEENPKEITIEESKIKKEIQD